MAGKPLKRKLYGAEPEQRIMYDPQHPGPISPQLKVTHRALLGVPYEFEFDLTNEVKSSSMKLYWRRTPKRRTGEEKKEDADDDVEMPGPGSVLLIVNVETNKATTVEVTEWYQKTPSYASGHCVVGPSTEDLFPQLQQQQSGDDSSDTT